MTSTGALPCGGSRAGTRSQRSLSPRRPRAASSQSRRTPPLTQAQAEALAIIAYLQPVSRPEVARIRGVSSESAVATLAERGLIEESGRSRFGAVVYRTTPLFEKLFGLSGLDRLPDPSRFDPTPEDERDLRQRLLRGRRAAGNLTRSGGRHATRQVPRPLWGRVAAPRRRADRRRTSSGRGRDGPRPGPRRRSSEWSRGRSPPRGPRAARGLDRQQAGGGRLHGARARTAPGRRRAGRLARGASTRSGDSTRTRPA